MRSIRILLPVDKGRVAIWSRSRPAQMNQARGLAYRLCLAIKETAFLSKETKMSPASVSHRQSDRRQCPSQLF